jgi:hypothetical protein
MYVMIRRGVAVFSLMIGIAHMAEAAAYSTPQSPAAERQIPQLSAGAQAITVSLSGSAVGPSANDPAGVRSMMMPGVDQQMRHRSDTTLAGHHWPVPTTLRRPGDAGVSNLTGHKSFDQVAEGLSVLAHPIHGIGGYFAA